MLGIEPQQFFLVETAGRRTHVFQIKPFHKFFHAEEFVVAVGPAQARQVIQQSLWQNALAVVIDHAHGIAAFGHFLAIGIQNHRQMAVHRHGVGQ